MEETLEKEKMLRRQLYHVGDCEGLRYISGINIRGNMRETMDEKEKYVGILDAGAF